VKYLIVNGDDFGASRGINRGIVELYELGILTSTSLMISMPAAGEAITLARSSPRLGVGLHVELTRENGSELVDLSDAARCASEIASQVESFSERLGRLPTHIDSHQNVHRKERLQPIFQQIAEHYALPLREHSPARYFSRFYGQWDGEPHPEHIGIESLLRMLDDELNEGITELSCHPGYPGPDFESPYDSERAIELRTLSDPRLREYLDARYVRLINFSDVVLEESACGI
jgi:chitin disaccharide deacetylase